MTVSIRTITVKRQAPHCWVIRLLKPMTALVMPGSSMSMDAKVSKNWGMMKIKMATMTSRETQIRMTG